MYSENVGGNWGLPAGYMETLTAPGRSYAAAISSVGSSIAGAITKYQENKAEDAYVTERYEALAPHLEKFARGGNMMDKNSPESKTIAQAEKFHSGSLAQKKAALHAAEFSLNRFDREEAKLEEQSRYMADRAMRDWSFKQSQDEAARAAADRDAFNRMMRFKGQPGQMVEQLNRQTTQQIPEALVQAADFLRPFPSMANVPDRFTAAPRTEGQPEPLIERLDRLKSMTKESIEQLNRPPLAGQGSSVPPRGVVTLRDEGGGVFRDVGRYLEDTYRVVEKMDANAPLTWKRWKAANEAERAAANTGPSVPPRGVVTLRDEGGGAGAAMGDVGRYISDKYNQEGLLGFVRPAAQALMASSPLNWPGMAAAYVADRGAERTARDVAKLVPESAVRVVAGNEGVKLRNDAVQADAMMASAPSEAFRDSARLPQPTTTPVAPQKMVPFTTSEPQASVFVPRNAQQAVAEMMQYAKEQGIQMTPQLYQQIQQRAFAENPPETPAGQQSDTTTIGPGGQTTRTYKSGKENELKPVTGFDGKPSPYFATVNGQLVKLADPTPAEARSMTEAQGKALQYLTEMQQTTSVFTKIENQGYNPTSNLWDRLTPSVMNSREGVAYSNAMDKWIEAVLRDRSGAAIADPEYAKARKVFFPEYRDSAKNVQNKRELREAAMRAMNDRVIGRPGNVYTQFGKMEGGTEVVRDYNPATRDFNK